MKKLNSKVLFFTTSPRTPAKMIPEIELLDKYFHNQKWNHSTQVDFMKYLKEEDFFRGKGENDPAFSARDRINRGPKALGFIRLSPTISLTPVGEALVAAVNKEEVFLRQLLKYQLPSPYHKFGENSADFRVRPFLEIFRLIRKLGNLSFEEMKIFGLQLTDYRLFNQIVEKIQQFRKRKNENKGNYKRFLGEYQEKEIEEIYKDEIVNGNIKIRENQNVSLRKFIETKAKNMRDYADACFRYLRASGVVNISQSGHTLTIVPERMKDVDFFLKNTDREPVFLDDLEQYITWLGSTNNPVLLTDNKKRLIEKIRRDFSETEIPVSSSLQDLKNLLNQLLINRKKKILEQEVRELKDSHFYEDIQNTFTRIEQKSLYDIPLMLEWNVWRAMTMLDGGTIQANLKFDDFGQPLSTAQGNMADIECDYGNFGLIVEVTTLNGQKQYEAEGEPVARHLGKWKKVNQKPAYGLFIAPNINESTITYFYTLHKLNLDYYGGFSTIVPLPVKVFRKMLEVSHSADYVPSPIQVQRLFEFSNKIADVCSEPKDWFQQIQDFAENWLNI